MNFASDVGVLPVAALDSPAGHLYFYDVAAIATVIKSLSSACSPASPALLEGFTMEQWAAFGRRKSAIASRVSKENGALKAKLLSAGRVTDEAEMTARRSRTDANNLSPIDPLQVNDPWFGRSVPRDLRDTVNSACSCSPWSAWSPTERSFLADGLTERDDVMSQGALEPCDSFNGSQTLQADDITPSDDAGDPTFPFHGDWQSLPASAWLCIHSRFACLNSIGEQIGMETVEAKEFLFNDEGQRSSQAHLSNAHYIIEQLRAYKATGWDPIKESEVASGATVLADSTFLADNGQDMVEECARGLIVDCQPNLLCKIAFLNKGQASLTFASLSLPDDRILYPMPHDDSDYEWDGDNSSGCDSR